jgi:hypothetical protein
MAMRKTCQLGVFACATILLFAPAPASPQSCTDLEDPHPAFKWVGLEPVALFTEYNPWAMAVGSDTPTFALYVDGTVIYRQSDRRSGQYVTAKLSTSQVKDFLQTAGFDDLFDLNGCYSLESATDLPTNVLTVKTSRGFKTIDIYGVIRPIAELPSSSLPPRLRAALRTFLTFRTENTQPWKPQMFEVLIWPFDYARSKLDWPAKFPGISDPNTKKTRQGFRLYLPIADLDQYQSFVAKLKPTQAVLIDGKKWTLSARLPFPHEGAPI